MNLGKIEQSAAVRAIGIRLLKVHQEVYVRSGGRVGHKLFGTRNLILRTVGAKSGKARVNALTYARDGAGDDAPYVIVASMGGAPKSPGWYHNLRGRPDAEIQVGTRRIPVTARAVLGDDPDRDRLWQLVNRHNDNRYTGYQRHTTRTIPVVVLSPR
jgi:deazaflavin-dependent oxidoreductase (nitroreductase family)